MNFIVNDVKDSLQGYLVKQIYKVSSKGVELERKSHANFGEIT